MNTAIRNSGNTVALAVILACGIFTVFFNLGNDSLSDDEFFLFDAAAGYHKTSTFHPYNFVNGSAITSIPEYARAWPFTTLIACSFRFFGTNEWAARLPSALFGIMCIGTIFFFCLSITKSRSLAVISATALLLNDSFLFYARFTRMYTAFMVLFLVAAWQFYLYLAPARQNNGLSDNFKTRHMVIGAIVITASIFIHINSLLLFPAIALFLAYLTVIHRNRVYIGLSAIVIAALVVLIALRYSTNFDPFYSTFITIRKEVALDYIVYFFRYPFRAQYKLNILLFILSVYFHIRHKKHNELAFFMSIFSIAIFFAFFSNKDPGMQYMLVLLPFILVFNLYAVIAIITAIHSKKSFGLVLLVLPVTYLAFKHYQTKDSLYFGENYKPKYSRALSALQPITRDQKEFLCFYPLRSYYIAKYNLNSKFEVISTETLLKRLTADTTSLTQLMTNGGYIGWTTFRTLKIPIEIREFTNKECRKIGGEGIDNTNIELYHFSKKAR